jgi:ribose 1,5-bisphosphokinase
VTMQGPGKEQRIGPGRLILIVGPSGAGKDTLITLARNACRDDPDVVFPRRVVTRATSAHEDHDTLSPEYFEEAARMGAFALHWSAHGLRYGIPIAIDADIGRDRTIVCNVSRTIVEQARSRYAAVIPVLITAPDDVLAARLAARGRETGSGVDGRIRRTAAIDPRFQADFAISNVGDPQVAAAELLSIILAGKGGSRRR